MIKLLESFDKLMSERGVSVVLRERLTLLREEMDGVLRENDRLRAELQASQAECAELRDQIEAHSVPDDFVKHRGVLFRRFADGRIEDQCYCSKCRGAMISFGNGLMEYTCRACGTDAPFTSCDIKRIVAEIH